MQQVVTERPGGILAADCALCGWPTTLRAPGIRTPLPDAVTIICPDCVIAPAPAPDVRKWRGSTAPIIDRYLDELEAAGGELSADPARRRRVRPESLLRGGRTMSARRAAAAAVLAGLALVACNPLVSPVTRNAPSVTPSRLACPRVPSSCHPFEVIR